MSSPRSRRDLLKALGLAAVAAPFVQAAAAAAPAKAMRGVFIILNTPFTAAGEVDWQDLEREVDFVDKAGCAGVVWPQGSSGVATLTRDERLRGMEVLAQVTRPRRLTLALGVQGRDTGEMLAYMEKAVALGTDAVIAMPPTSGRTLEDYRAYFSALGRASSLPTIVQTSGGARDLYPSVELIVELARLFPHMAYVKEESDPVVARMRGEIAARPTLKGIFGASLGSTLLYDMRLGVDGIITGMGMYADLMARMWALHDQGRRDEVRELYARFLLMRNLNESVPGTDLYVMKKRGIFKTAVRRTGPPSAGKPAGLADLTPAGTDLDELEFRFAALAPYLSR